MDKHAQFLQTLQKSFAVQLFERRTGFSVEWLVDKVVVTPSDDPDAGPMQWPVGWPHSDLDAQHLPTLQAAALVALWWRDAMADAPFLTYAQRDALAARNLIDDERAKTELERAWGGDTRAKARAQLQEKTRQHIRRALSKEPDLTRGAIFERANAFLKAGRSSARSDQTLAKRKWLRDLLPEGKTGPKRR